MSRWLHRLLAKCTANAVSQEMLERSTTFLLQLMGVGAGYDPFASGEHILVDKLKRLRSPHSVLQVFDVGANQGQFLEMIRKELRDVPFEVHSFEPSKRSFERLCIAANGDPRVRVNNCALGNFVSTARLHYDFAGSELASLSKRRLHHLGIDFTASEEVQIGTLDTYCRQNNISEIHLLKIDVEGHELDVLNGSLEMFASKKIFMVSFEFGGCNIDSRTYLQDFWYFFKDHGMTRFYRITPSGYLAPIAEYREIFEQFRTTNFLVERVVSAANDEKAH